MRNVKNKAFEALCTQKANSHFGTETKKGAYTSLQIQTANLISQALQPLAVMSDFLMCCNSRAVVLQMANNILYQFKISPAGSVVYSCLNPEMITKVDFRIKSPRQKKKQLESWLQFLANEKNKTQLNLIF